MALSSTLLAIGVAVVASLVFVAVPQFGGPSSMRLFLRFAVGFFLCVLGAGVMYVIARTSGDVLFRVIADTAMVLAPSLLFVGLFGLTERRALGPGVLAFTLTVAVAVVSTTVPPPTSPAVKNLAVVVACAACSWAALRARVEPARPLRVIAAIGAGYGLYSLVRMIVGLAAGWDGARVLADRFFLPALVTGLAVATVVAASGGWFALAQRRVSAAQRRPAGTLVVLGDWRLASAAYGPERIRTLVVELQTAARELDPDAVDVQRGVEVVLPSPVSTLATRVRERYGWNSDEVALLSEGAPTAAVRLPILSTRRPPRIRSPRT